MERAARLCDLVDCYQRQKLGIIDDIIVEGDRMMYSGSPAGTGAVAVVHAAEVEEKRLGEKKGPKQREDVEV